MSIGTFPIQYIVLAVLYSAFFAFPLQNIPSHLFSSYSPLVPKNPTRAKKELYGDFDGSTYWSASGSAYPPLQLCGQHSQALKQRPNSGVE